MELLDSRRLRHFLAVYDLRSIGQAAEKLFLTQPALSKSIRQLEEDLQIKLFDRTPLGVVPTVFGDALAQHAKVIRSEIRHAETEIANLRGGTRGHVTVGVGPSVAANFMPMATQLLRKERPGIHFTVIEGLVDTLIPALRRGEIDLAIGAWPRIVDGDLTAEVVLREQLGVVAGPKHPLVKKKRVELQELLEFPWALPPETQRWRQILEETFLAQGFSAPIPVVTSNSANYIRTLLLDNDFLSYLSHQLLPAPHKLTLVPLPLQQLSREIDITVTYRERAVLPPASQALIGAFRSLAAGS